MRVLVLSAAASAINVIYALKSDPAVRLFAADMSRFAPGLYVDGVTPVLIPGARNRRRYRAALDAAIVQHAIDVLIPSSDRDVEAVVALLHEGWNPPVQMFRPPFAAQQILAHKDRLMARLSRTMPGIVPRTLGPGEVARAVELGFPLVAKPVDEGGSKGVAIVNTQAALEVELRRLRARFGEAFVLQEFIPGRVGSTYLVLMLYDQEGRLRSATTMQSHLTYLTWGGGGNAGAMVYEPEMIESAARIVEECGGWCGPVNLEYRRHETSGRMYVMEANCRLNGYSYLATMNGFNLPRAMVSLLSGQDCALPLQRDTTCPRSFILGFREQVVDDWVGARPRMPPV
jgi:predicted ATP-grasp superfamily ATP-dependent carboligase